MKFPISFCSWTARAALEIEIPDDTKTQFCLGVALEIAVSNRTNLAGALLNDAWLVGADLTDAMLAGALLAGALLAGALLNGAWLVGADLSDADLSNADLSNADLTNAMLAGAGLSGANLSGANLDHANLDVIRSDLIAEILKLPNELEALRSALINGRIDGSTYVGKCRCLAGTLGVAHGDANYAGADIIVNDSLTFMARGSSLRERWFAAILPGDTPKTNAVAAIAVEWVDEAIAIRDLIRSTSPK
jgi:uncharacterized protein YjbI with pentapeptide repeats